MTDSRTIIELVKELQEMTCDDVGIEYCKSCNTRLEHFETIASALLIAVGALEFYSKKDGGYYWTVAGKALHRIHSLPLK